MKTKAKTQWTPEQERLLINWAEKATGYAWLHNRSVNYFKNRNLYIVIPASFFGYIAGATSFISSGDGNNNIYISTVIGVCGILAGLLTNLQEIFTFKELSEQHRISALRFLSFFRDISCELSINPDHRTDPIEYITMKRMELDKLLEQSPMPPQSIIEEFNNKFKKVQIHKPDLANNLQTIIPYGVEMCNKQFEPSKRLSKKQLMKKYFNMWRQNVLVHKHRRVSHIDGVVEVANSETSSVNYNPNNIHIDQNNVHINFDKEDHSLSSSSNNSDSNNANANNYNDNYNDNYSDIITSQRSNNMNSYNDIVTSQRSIRTQPFTDILTPKNYMGYTNNSLKDESMMRRMTEYDNILDYADNLKRENLYLQSLINNQQEQDQNQDKIIIDMSFNQVYI
jgi:hypothetical protein